MQPIGHRVLVLAGPEPAGLTVGLCGDLLLARLPFGVAAYASHPRLSFGSGGDLGLFTHAQACLAQLSGDVAGGVGGDGGVGIPDVQQGAVVFGPQVHSLGRGQLAGGGMPQRALFRSRGRGLGADRIGRMLIGVQLAVGAGAPGAPLPLQPADGVFGDQAEGEDGPCWRLRGQVLADAFGPVVHRGRELTQVPLVLGIGGLRDALGPAVGGPWDLPGGAGPDPVIQLRGGVLGVLQRPLGHGLAQQLPGVVPGGLGGAQRPPQPDRLVGQLGAGVLGAQRRADQPLVPGDGERPRLAFPLGVQEGHVVGARHVPPRDLGRGGVGFLVGHDVGQDGDRFTLWRVLHFRRLPR